MEEVFAERLPHLARKINLLEGGDCWGLVTLALPPGSNYARLASQSHSRISQA
jgi:hypothetical protein